MLIAGQKPPAGAYSDGNGNDASENGHPRVGAINFRRCWFNEYSGMMMLPG